MADPTTSPEDHAKHSDVAFADGVFDPILFADASRTGNLVSRANSISSTSASSVPNTGVPPAHGVVAHQATQPRATELGSNPKNSLQNSNEKLLSYNSSAGLGHVARPCGSVCGGPRGSNNVPRSLEVKMFYYPSILYNYSFNMTSDDEDSDCRHETLYKTSCKDRRRQAHTQAEQKRRDAIKKGYDDLQSVVPTCLQSEFAVGAQKISKATILQKTIEYIKFLHKEKKKQEEEVSRLRKEVTALKIMKTNYEQIVKAYQNHPQQGADQVSDQIKFNIFQSIMDSLFYTFSSSVSVNSFQELSASVINWIEEHCKPLMLKEFVVSVLRQVNGQLY